MDKDNKKFPFEKERFEEKFPSKKEAFVIRKKRRQILVLFLSFSGYILRGFHTYSNFRSIVISSIPLSTYHHPSETPYPSHLQNGDRLSTTYHRSVSAMNRAFQDGGDRLKEDFYFCIWWREGIYGTSCIYSYISTAFQKKHISLQYAFCSSAW